MLGEVMPSVYAVISEHMSAMQPEAHAQTAAELSKVCEGRQNFPSSSFYAWGMCMGATHSSDVTCK